MSDQETIQDDSKGGRKYFGTIPHMAGVKLDVYEHRLYCHYVEVCGVSKTDECFQAEKTICAATDMSKQRFRKARQGLIDKKFVTFRAGMPNKKGVKGYSALTTIIDIWAENITFCQRRSYTGNILPVEGVNNYPLKGQYITPIKNKKNIEEKKTLSPQVQGDGDSDKTFANTGELGHTQVFTLWTCDGCHEQRVRVIWTPCKPGDTGLYAKCTLCGYEHIDDAPFDSDECTDSDNASECVVCHKRKGVYTLYDEPVCDWCFKIIKDTPVGKEGLEWGRKEIARLELQAGCPGADESSVTEQLPKEQQLATGQVFDNLEQLTPKQQKQQLSIFCGKCNGSGTVTEWEKADGCPDCGHSERPQHADKGVRPDCNELEHEGTCLCESQHTSKSVSLAPIDDIMEHMGFRFVGTKVATAQQVVEEIPAPQAKKKRKARKPKRTPEETKSINALVDAIVAVFKRDTKKMPQSDWNFVKRIANELFDMPTPATPEQIAKVYKHCKDKFDNFGYGAIASNYAAWSTTVNPEGQSIEKDRPFTISEE